MSNNDTLTEKDFAKVNAIAQRLKKQDNRATRDPMFCVQVCERIGPLVPEYSEDLMFHDSVEMETYYADKNPEVWGKFKKLHDDGELPDTVIVGGYQEKWLTVCVCFTEEGCKQHLDLNGHNYRHYFGTRIYTESFYRNPEMLTIREYLLALATPSCETLGSSSVQGGAVQLFPVNRIQLDICTDLPSAETQGPITQH